jgi:phage terminase large subunit GpA-like protein
LGLLPPPPLSAVEWLDKYYYLPTESSAEAGKFSSDRVPYIREIAYHLSPQSPTKKVSVVKAVQMGLTEFANGLCFYYAHLHPSPMLFGMPTEKLCLDHATDKMWAAIQATPILKNEVIIPRKRENGSSLLNIRFAGGFIKLGHAGSAVTFASRSIRILIKDDLDRWGDDVNGEGDPSTLADKRTTAFPHTKKIYSNSSPTMKRNSKIWREYLDGSQALFNIPCPHCENFFPFERENFSYETDGHSKIEGDVVCICPHCEGVIEEWRKGELMLKGVFIHRYPKREHKSYRIPAYYSPFVSWKTIFGEYERARDYFRNGYEGELKDWVNTRDAKIWEVEKEIEEQLDILKLRVFLDEGEVPTDTVGLSMGIDVQKDHMWFIVTAWRNNDSWHIVEYGRVTEWDTLEEVLRRDYYDENGVVYNVKMCAVDSGYKQQEAYKFAKANSRIVVPVKGGSHSMPTAYRASTAEKDRRNKILLKLYILNPDYYKNQIHDKIIRSLVLEESGENIYEKSNCITLNEKSEEQIAIQWTREHETEKIRHNGTSYLTWMLKNPNDKNNHLWDCMYYSVFAGDFAGLRHKRVKKITKRRDRTIRKGF